MKSKETIQRENLRKTLTRLKVRVADMEELWLQFFQDAINLTMTAYYENGRAGLVKDHVKEARDIADWALDEYESRWGKG